MKYIRIAILVLIIASISIFIAQYLVTSMPEANFTYLFSIAVIIITVGSIGFPRYNLGILRSFSDKSGFSTFQKMRLTLKIKELRTMCWQVFYLGIFLSIAILLTRFFSTDYWSLTLTIFASLLSTINFFGQILLSKKLDSLNDEFKIFLNKNTELKKMNDSKL